MPAFSTCSAVTGVTATGTSCSALARRVAVTMICSSVAVCASAGETTTNAPLMPATHVSIVDARKNAFVFRHLFLPCRCAGPLWLGWFAPRVIALSSFHTQVYGEHIDVENAACPRDLDEQALTERRVTLKVTLGVGDDMAVTERDKQSAPANLDVQAWIDAAFDALAQGGIDAVRIDPLAKDLGVTRGSFYWHFKDRAALHQAMLKEWRTRASYQIYTRVERSAESAGDRLRRLLALPYSSPRSARGASIELAIRLWARRDKDAAKAVRHIDRTRLTYFNKLYEEHGLGKEEAKGRAFLFYAHLMAEAIISVDPARAPLAACETFLLD